MEDKTMFATLEQIRKSSLDVTCTHYAMTNGTQIVDVSSPFGLKAAQEKKRLEDNGYWLVAIYEAGHRVEA